MSRELYDALGRPRDGVDPWTDEDEPPRPLLSALAQAAVQRRRARALAEGELQDGLWVDEEDPSVEGAVRLAASDAAGFPATYTAEGWRVRVDDSVTLIDGTGGVTVVIGGVMVPLERGRPAARPALDAPPEHIVLVDATGRRVRLERE